MCCPFLVLTVFVKGLWILVWRCFGGPPRCPKSVEGTTKPEIRRDPSQNSWNLVCRPPLYWSGSRTPSKIHPRITTRSTFKIEDLPGAPKGSNLMTRTKDLASRGPRNFRSRGTLPPKKETLPKIRRGPSEKDVANLSQAKIATEEHVFASLDS